MRVITTSIDYFAGPSPRAATFNAPQVTLIGTTHLRHAANNPLMRPVPPRPTRFLAAIEHYLRHMSLEGANSPRVLVEKKRLLKNMIKFIVATRPALGADPVAHEIGPRDVDDFVLHLRERAGKDRFGDGTTTKSAPRTIEKKLRMIAHFFGHCVSVLEALVDSPAAALRAVSIRLKDVAEREGRHYLPFTRTQIAQIFDPEAYLARMRQPDLFWVPLLAVHLGVRAGDVVRLRIEDFVHDAIDSMWCVNIRLVYTKNKTSVRRLPITQPLVDLGLIDYINHVEALGGEQLFPNRDYNTATLSRDPSKKVSAAFAELLELHGIRHPDFTFHSFRHTVVGALHDAGVSLVDAMKITGHEAQDHAIRAGLVTKKAARSVHMQFYTHADRPRLHVDNPNPRHKSQLEMALPLPLDYARLRVAADIVREHTCRSAGGFKAGWPGQNRRYTEQQLRRLRAVGP